MIRTPCAAPPEPDLADEPTARAAYFREYGYLIRRSLLDASLCARAVECFTREISPFEGFLYRQASANPETHRLGAGGQVMNSLLNPISVDGRRFPGFRAISEEILSQARLFEAVEELQGETTILVQSMYFEGNPATWPHQDCYYLDSERSGGLIGAWIALEDIDERAGRFYVVPGSQRLDLGSNAGRLNIAENHERYKQLVARTIETGQLERRAPALKRGDVLLWGSRTIHGALAPSGTQHARNSYTAHFLPASTRFMQYQCIAKRVNPELVGGRLLCRPKDQARWLNRIVFAAEVRAPRLFRMVKRMTIERRIERSFTGG